MSRHQNISPSNHTVDEPPCARDVCDCALRRDAAMKQAEHCTQGHNLNRKVYLITRQLPDVTRQYQQSRPSLLTKCQGHGQGLLDYVHCAACGQQSSCYSRYGFSFSSALVAEAATGSVLSSVCTHHEHPQALQNTSRTRTKTCHLAAHLWCKQCPPICSWISC